MSWSSAFWWPHTVKIQPVTGGGGMGHSHGPAEETAAEVIDEQKLVRDAMGAQLVSNTAVTVPLDTDVTPGALVTVWPGGAGERTAKVLSIERAVDDPPLPSHLVLRLE